MESLFCVAALQQALTKGTPLIFNTDQGSPFTSEAFTGVLLDKNIAISMDGRVVRWITFLLNDYDGR